MSTSKRNILHAATRAQWRTWLKRNHDQEREVWLAYAKKGSGERSVTYAEAVEEAICFGWIDGVVNPLDETYWIQRFTPRANVRNWSAINLERFERMVAEGKMTPAGLAKKPADVTPPPPRLSLDDPMPPVIAAALAKNAKARAAFDKLPPSHRRNYLRWIMEAKQEETKLRRLEQMVARLVGR